MKKAENILGLDIGNVRIGVAVTNSIARIPRPLAVVDNDETVFSRIKSMLDEHDIKAVVIGLPRNMDGAETKQSAVSREFSDRLKEYISVPVFFADESLSSRRAEQNRFKGTAENKGHLDDIAACFILEEYLEENK